LIDCFSRSLWIVMVWPMRPASKIGAERLPSTLATVAAGENRRPAFRASTPSEPVSVSAGSRCRRAASVRANAASIPRSAARTSGRWRSVSAGMPIAASAGMAGRPRGFGQQRIQRARSAAGKQGELIGRLRDGQL
jgi:hypothetical protein